MSNGHSSAAIYPSRCPHCRNWIGNSISLEEKMIHTQHILSGCKKFQNQGRYNWRHDAVLNYIGKLEGLPKIQEMLKNLKVDINLLIKL